MQTKSQELAVLICYLFSNTYQHPTWGHVSYFLFSANEIDYAFCLADSLDVVISFP